MIVKNKIGPVKVFMDRSSLNGLLYCLDYLIAISDGEWEKNAKRIKEKILKHGRRFTNNNTGCAAICFYENEAAVLIKAFSLYVFLTRNPPKDYYAAMQRSQNDAEENV